VIESSTRKDELVMGNPAGESRWRPLATPRARTPKYLLIVLAAPLWAGIAGQAAGAELLSWKFKPGETLRYTMLQQTTRQTKAAGREEKMSSSQTTDLHWTVKSVGTDGSAELGWTVDRIRTKLEAPGATIEYDSQSGKAPEGQPGNMGAFLSSLVGAEFTFKMSRRGEMSDFKFPQKLLESIRQAAPPGAPEGTFGEDALKSMASQASVPLPAEPIEKGKAWNQSARVSLPTGTMQIGKTYTFQGPDPEAPGMHRISVDTKVSLGDAANTGVAIKVTSQKGEGTIVFDSQSGRIVSSRLQDQLQFSLTFMGQELQRTTDTVTTMTLGKGS
jgi:hypothetical protein